MSGRSILLLSCLMLLALSTFADEPALVAKDLSLSNPDKSPTLAGAENPDLPTLAPIDTVYIGVGNTWELYLRGRTPSGEPPTLIGVALPSGAVMTEVGDGWSVIYWQPNNDDVGRHVLAIRAMDSDDPNLVFERDIDIEVQATTADHASQAMVPAAANPGGPAVSSAAGTTTSITAASLTSSKQVPEVSQVTRQKTGRSSYIGSSEGATKEPGKTPAAIETGVTGANRQPPTLGPIATHIISAGKTLSVRVSPELDNKLPPIIHIDRLPPNASFDANEDGSRTFYWPTGDSDQGQHRFRFTVIHPDDASLKSTRDMTVIVGDPSQQFTIPADR